MTGVGDRVHLAHPGINLETHIADLLAVLKVENLRDVILVGHSYGGMVATGVADRAPERIKHVVYLDAFAPESGKSANDYGTSARVELMRKTAIGGWQVPSTPVPPDTSPEDTMWLVARRVPHPLACLEQKLVLKNGPLTLPRTYIYAQRYSPGDQFRQFMERARKDGWPVYEMDASHSPHITAPEALMGILQEVAISR
jgi:pimeloyl-ACP methyl ester carboxylesterase